MSIMMNSYGEPVPRHVLEENLVRAVGRVAYYRTRRDYRKARMWLRNAFTLCVGLTAWRVGETAGEILKGVMS